jgi:hypothetical protein
MDMLLKEMQEIDRFSQQPIMAPKVNEVIKSGMNDPVNQIFSPDSTLAEVI